MLAGEGGCQARMGQCLIFLFFFLKAYNFKAITTGFSFRYKKNWYMEGEVGVNRGDWC